MNTDDNSFQLLYQELPTVGLILDRQLNIRDINNYGCSQLGYAREELVGTAYTLLCMPEERDYVRQNLHQCLQDYPCLQRWDCGRLRKDGTHYWVRDTVRVIDDEEGKAAILIASEDITETRYLISELERKSSVDELTGLYNRRRFNLHLDELLLSGRPGGIRTYSSSSASTSSRRSTTPVATWGGRPAAQPGGQSAA